MKIKKGKQVNDSSVQSDINVTPMVDVMLVLLIIFMVITPMLQHGMAVDLAKTEAPKAMQDADKDDANLVAVTKDGVIYFGTEKIEAAALTAKLKEKMDNPKAEHSVFLKADARAKYGAVVDVVDNIRDAGVDSLGLLTDAKKSGAAAAAPPADDKKKK